MSGGRRAKKREFSKIVRNVVHKPLLTAMTKSTM